MVATNEPRDEPALPPGEDELRRNATPLLNGHAEPEPNPDFPEAFGNGHGLAAKYEAFGRSDPDSDDSAKKDEKPKGERPPEKDTGKKSEDEKKPDEKKKGEAKPDGQKEDKKDEKEEDKKPKKPPLYKRPSP